MSKKSQANVSSIKLYSFYMLTKGTNGVHVRSLVHHGWAQIRKPNEYQRAWLQTFEDPSKCGYLKIIDLLL
jgi:hypothetical protein